MGGEKNKKRQSKHRTYIKLKGMLYNTINTVLRMMGYPAVALPSKIPTDSIMYSRPKT